MITARVGQEVLLAAPSNRNAACTGLPVPELRISEPPRAGQLIFRVASVRVGANADRCAGRELPVATLFYRRTEPASSQPDSVKLEIVAGQSRQSQNFTITAQD